MTSSLLFIGGIVGAGAAAFFVAWAMVRWRLPPNDKPGSIPPTIRHQPQDDGWTETSHRERGLQFGRSFAYDADLSEFDSMPPPVSGD